MHSLLIGGLRAKKDSARATSAGGNENRQNTSPDNDETTYLTAEDRTQRIAVSAYYRAQRRGFEGAEALDDWLEAEREIDSSEGGRGVKHEVSVRSAAIENLEAGRARRRATPTESSRRKSSGGHKRLAFPRLNYARR